MSKTAIITGASSGIGKALAKHLAKGGFKVVIAARSTEKLNLIAEDINSSGGHCLVVSTDVSIPEEIDHLKSKALQYGNVSIVINNGFPLKPI